MINKYGIPVIIVVGAFIFSGLRFARPTSIQINQVNTTTKNSNVSITIQFNKNAKCKNISKFSLVSSLAYTSSGNLSPIKADSQNLTYKSLPSSLKLTYTVPSTTLNFGYSYLIGFTINQIKNNIITPIFTQTYIPINTNKTITLNCK